MPDVFLAKVPPCAGHRDRRALLALAKPPSGCAWRVGRTDDRRHRRLPRWSRAKMVGRPQFLYRCWSQIERAVRARSIGDRYSGKACYVRRDFLGLCGPLYARLECGPFGSALRDLDHSVAARIAQRYSPQPIPQASGHTANFQRFLTLNWVQILCLLKIFIAMSDSSSHRSSKHLHRICLDSNV